MKYIEVDEELYRYIASKTERIGESASDILRRLLELSVNSTEPTQPLDISHPSLEATAQTAESAPSTKGIDETDGIEATEKLTDTVSSLKTPHPIESELTEELTVTEVNFKDVVHEHMLSQQKGAVGRFMFLLESLSAITPATFEQILKIQGRGRLYFARSKAELLSASQSANPKEIGDSGYWVTTNNNTAKKRTILSEVLLQLGCNEALAKSIADRI